MKVQVRQETFETNSSSTHAICIYRDLDIDGVIGRYEDDVEYDLPYRETTLYFGCSGEFGWENKHYHDTEDKASYLWQCIVACNLVDKLKNRIKSTLKKYGVKAEFAKTEKRDYTNYLGEKSVYDVFVDNENDGYVDHGDEAKDMVMAICFSERLLLSYLFSENSFVATGNDNTGNLDITGEYDDMFDRLATFYKGN